MKNDNLIYFRSVMEQMTTEQLDEFLHEELNKESPNGEMVRQALKVLEEREKDIPIEITPEIEAAWENYKGDLEIPLDKPVWQRSRSLKVASLTAVLLVVLVVLSRPAAAKGFFDRLISWTDSLFLLLSPGDDSQEAYVFKTDNPGLQEVYDAVVGIGITDPVVPMWLPEGYELVMCKVTDSFLGKGISAELTNGTHSFLYRIYLYSNVVTNKYQKDETEVITIERGGTIHTIIENDRAWTVVWTKDNMECSFLIDCQEDILYKILGSIYTMED